MGPGGCRGPFLSPYGDVICACGPNHRAVENGITNGISATEFGVGGTCNRAQVVTFLYRTYNK